MLCMEKQMQDGAKDQEQFIHSLSSVVGFFFCRNLVLC